MARALEVKEDGYRIAATELNSLIHPDPKPDDSHVSSDLTLGYHVALFYGLQVSSEVRVTDDIAIVPFEQMVTAFVNRRVLRNVAPEIIEHKRWKSVGAVVTPFRWKPVFRERADDAVQELDWGSSFFRRSQGSRRTIGSVPRRPSHTPGEHSVLHPSHRVLSPGSAALQHRLQLATLGPINRQNCETNRDEY